MSATSDPSFRAWLDGLKAPAFLDMDVLLAAGVIDDDEDWLRWRDRGWVDFIIRATDAQQVALFGLVRERLEQQPKLVAADLVGDEERAA